MTPPISPADLELYEERAAIIEYQGNVPRAEAERQAMEAVRAYNRHLESVGVRPGKVTRGA